MQLVGLSRPVALVWRRWLARLDGAPVDLDGDGGGGANSGGGGVGAATDDPLRRFLRHLRPLPSRLADSFAPRPPDPAAMDLLASLLAVEPWQRCTCAQALGHAFFRRHLLPGTPVAPTPPAPAPAPAPTPARRSPPTPCELTHPLRSPRSPRSPPAAPALPHWGSLAALTEGCDEPRELLRRIKREVALCAPSELLGPAALPARAA